MDLKKKKEKELEKMLVERKEELRKDSFASSTTGKSSVDVSKIKKEIAQILTEVNSR